MLIPTDAIDAHALIRDRTHLDPQALDELQASIAANGLRLPVEVFASGGGYALISGYRRLCAIRNLHALTGADRWTQIEATLRSPAGPAAALAAMVEENEQRQPLSPWERARIAKVAVGQDGLPTLDTALTALYPAASRQKRAKLRAIAEVVEALEHELVDPELHSETRLMRLAAVLRLGWSDLLTTALTEPPCPTAEAQWQRISPILAEAEALVAAERPTTPNRPRRLSRPRAGITLRRERTRAGYVLHITGRNATDTVVGEVLEEVERWFRPE